MNRKVILCVNNGNQMMEDAVRYFKGEGHTTYLMEDMKDETISDRVDEIEKQEGYLDGLILSVNEHLKESKAREARDLQLLEILDDQLNGARETIERAIPLLRKGEGKRIGLITKAASSVSNNREDENYAYHMALAGLNMIGKIYFNSLREEGFTFRWYADTENADAKKGISAGEYFLMNLSYDDKEPYSHSDENRLVLRDSQLREIAW